MCLAFLHQLPEHVTGQVFRIRVSEISSLLTVPGSDLGQVTLHAILALNFRPPTVVVSASKSVLPFSFSFTS